MFKNYFITAIRNLKRNKLFSLINIAGLAIGISASLVIYLIVQYEFSFDKFHRDGDRIYRITSKIEMPDLTIENSGVPIPTAKAVNAEVTGIEATAYFITADEARVTVSPGGQKDPAVFRNQSRIIYAAEDYFNLFRYQWVAGAPIMLNDPFKVVLTEDRARTYFATLTSAEIIGREIVYNDSIRTTVAGIVRLPDQPSDFNFQEFISSATLQHSGLKFRYEWDAWDSFDSNSQLFVKLKQGVNPAQIEKQLGQLRDKYREKRKETTFDETEHALQPLADMHFNAAFDIFENRQAHMPTLYGLLAVASFLLLLGCINFINLTTAQATQRAKEIGIRKTIGGGRKQLVLQFLSETFALTFIATVLSVLITPWLLHVFGDFIPEGVSFSSLDQPHVWLFLVLLMIVVTLLSGLYPAFMLSKYKPVAVLKNQLTQSSGTRKAGLRKALTIAQFIIAQFLIIATLVVSKQVHYSLNKELGYKRDAIVYFNTRWNFFSNQTDARRFTLFQKLKAIPEINAVSLSGASPASNNTSSSFMKFQNGEKKVETMVEIKYADTSYFNVYGMKLLAGRQMQPSDTTKEFIINETYARLLGFEHPADAVGHYIEKDKTLPVVGVIADFHAKSTREVIKPLVFANASDQSYTLHLALASLGDDNDKWKRALAKAGKAFSELYPEDDFKPTFYDQSIERFYTTEKNMSRLLTWAAGLCIFISCLGLLGLVIYITNTRTKEIGVRKVLGASLLQIVSLISRDFLSLVLIAFVIVLPVSWWAMQEWLADFSYRTALSWWIFAITGAGMLLIALLTLAFRTLKTAMENPIKSLRTE